MTHKSRSILFLLIAVLAIAAGCAGERTSVREIIKCVFSRCVSEPPNREGLNTVPFYDKNSTAFSSGTAKVANVARQSPMDSAITDAEKEKLLIEKVKTASTKDGATIATEQWKSPDKLTEGMLPEAVRGLPKDKVGYVDWAAAYKDGFIAPMWSISDSGKDPEDFDLDIVFAINDQLMADVLFEHRKHVAWLTCTNCHPSVFIPQKGANVFNMYDVWDGKYCGKCHSTVAFQAKGFDNCQRCHSVKKNTSAAGI